MKHQAIHSLFRTLVILLACSFVPCSISAQSDSLSVSVRGEKPISVQDSNDAVLLGQAVLYTFSTKNVDSLLALSNDSIYCLLCIDMDSVPPLTTILSRTDFLVNHFDDSFFTKKAERAFNHRDMHLLKEDNSYSYITVNWTTYKQDELVKGHEGEELGLYFLKVDGELRFSGIETIP